MAAQHILDAVEEDAADLQFPKDWPSMVVQEMESPGPLCYTCGLSLKEPYIRCAECYEIKICPGCFSCGAEADPHKNDHSYIVVQNDFNFFEGSSWTAREELELLDALLECGLGNWSDISRRVQTHSAQECERHYMKNYVENHYIPELPQFREPVSGGTGPMPFFDFKLTDSDDPPRYVPSSSSSRAMAGYNAVRSDFEIEYDNFAEADICELKADTFDDEDEYQELGRALQAGVVARYNERLRERVRRKKILRDHGLIVIRKTLSWLQRYDSTITRSIVERLFPFMRLVSDEDFTLILEGLHHAGELRLYMARLQELREMGLTRFASGRIYQQLEQHREEFLKERRSYMSNPAYCWQSVSDTGLVPSLPMVTSPCGPMRRQAPPLDIVGLPGYEHLSQAERQLCSTARIVPESYLTFRRLLTAEYKRNGGLKLAQARSLIKIDVNKTKKLYDFLLQEGYIQQPP
ncbi:transcriptional adapter 2-alpha [Anabrus simplex]|uniref:transcriptional adapter 2-alpha n=1 Tax=Anabrus simplex TaxID=316456 RepID=UPI0035A28574